MHNSDNIYAKPMDQVSEFRFDEHVAEVFPDMIQRSVPGYTTILDVIGKLTQRFHQSQSRLYDLGCSLGAATLAMRRNIYHPDCEIIGVDNSEAMLERCQTHLNAYRSDTPVSLQLGDIQTTDITNASVVVLNFTLQFIAPEQRDALIKRIYQGMRPGGILIVSEKLHFADEKMNELMIDLHLDFKRANGYSELEISQKRTAIENVLLTDTEQSHLERFKSAGFEHAQKWYQCFNFTSFVAVKGE